MCVTLRCVLARGVPRLWLVQSAQLVPRAACLSHEVTNALGDNGFAFSTHLVKVTETCPEAFASVRRRLEVRRL